MSEPTELRQLVASEHGLPEESASFLAGATVEEIEESATAFAKLLEERREQEAATSFFGAVADGKAARQRALVNLVTGRAPQQPRDEHGRFTAGGFDGGARPGLPPAPESHDEMLLRILRSREADGGIAAFRR
jgi:hypothetical protein